MVGPNRLKNHSVIADSTVSPFQHDRNGVDVPCEKCLLRVGVLQKASSRLDVWVASTRLVLRIYNYDLAVSQLGTSQLALFPDINPAATHQMYGWILCLFYLYFCLTDRTFVLIPSFFHSYRVN